MTLHDENSVPDLREDIVKFVKALQEIENEKSELNDRKKDLIEDFKSKFDVKTLQQALKFVSVKNSVAHKHEFDTMVEILEKEFAVLF